MIPNFADRFDGISGSAIREIFKLIARPGVISFAGGNPSPKALPDDLVGEIAAKVIKEDGKRILQYGATEGYPPFLESLSNYLKNKHAFDLSNNLVLPTTGSTQGMDLLCKALINPGDVIITENPTFLGNMQAMRLYQAKLVGVDCDNDGIIIDELEAAIKKYKPKMLYIIPTFQNPGGTTLSLERRKKIVALAEEYGFIVAEDDPYGDLRFSGESLPTIKSFDKTGNVVYLGSFSKIISPGMRVGYMVGENTIIRKCTIGKQSSDLHTANLTQAIVDKFLRENLLDDLIEKIKEDYSIKMQTMLDALKDFPEGTKYTKPEGGMFIFVKLPQGLNATELLNTAVSNNVAYVPGTHFYTDGGRENTLRLNFTNSDIDTIKTGMAKIAEIFKDNNGGK
ncbi:MAG: PLP-dependent aminotransferase family protein [Christensenellaceae bacterium]|nr:PLP-dependent aminotransferase family protein [Christensenellaceae bacterium]